jgi:catechol 2,3-dioxygenase-like lactoylglutathione lyase family enzyme
MTQSHKPLLSKIDCVQLPVPNLDAALAFYRDRLGHELLWRTDDSIGLRVPESDVELVLQTTRSEPEVDWLVDSVERAVARFTAAGGSVEVPPFNIPIGRCVVVRDPWGNRLVFLDLTEGRFATDADGNVVGNTPAR